MSAEAASQRSTPLDIRARTPSAHQLKKFDEAAARAMAKAMQTGELPPKTAPYYKQVKTLADWHWEEIEKEKARARSRKNGGGL